MEQAGQNKLLFLVLKLVAVIGVVLIVIVKCIQRDNLEHDYVNISDCLSMAEKKYISKNGFVAIYRGKELDYTGKATKRACYYKQTNKGIEVFVFVNLDEEGHLKSVGYYIEQSGWFQNQQHIIDAEREAEKLKGMFLKKIRK